MKKHNPAPEHKVDTAYQDDYVQYTVDIQRKNNKLTNCLAQKRFADALAIATDLQIKLTALQKWLLEKHAKENKD